MASAGDLRRIALSLRGTAEVSHFNRSAFKVVRIYVTLAPSGQTANFKFTPDEQEFKCMMAPDAFAPVANAWGKQGWTTCTLARTNIGDLSAALEMAWRHAQPRKHRRK
jgi:YjbR